MVWAGTPSAGARARTRRGRLRRPRASASGAASRRSSADSMWLVTQATMAAARARPPSAPPAAIDDGVVLASVAARARTAGDERVGAEVCSRRKRAQAGQGEAPDARTEGTY